MRLDGQRQLVEVVQACQLELLIPITYSGTQLEHLAGRLKQVQRFI